jgi:CRP-like cAMP-binding protein
MLEFLRGGPDTPRKRTLQQMSLLKTLSRRELNVLDGLLHERHYLKGEIVFDQGEEGQALHIVIAGSVLICHQGEPVAGRVRTIGPGDLFGEIALLENMPRALQARAEEDCQLVSLSRGDLESLIETHATIASKLLLQLARHLARQLIQTSYMDGAAP